MKKFRICALLVALAVLIAAVPFTAFADGSEPGLIYDFYEKSVMENYGYTSLTNCTVEWVEGVLRSTAAENIMEADDGIGDPNFMIADAQYADLDCSEYPYFAINLKNPSEATQFEVHFGTDEHGLSASNVFHLDIEGGMDTFKTFYCYIPTQNEKWVNILNAPGGLSEQETGSYTAPEMEEGGSFWEGYLNSLRIDGVYFGGRSGLVPGGTSYDIAWIAFFKTEDDVKNFAGPDRTKPTPEPTPTPDISTIAPFGTIIFDSDDYDDFWTGANLIDDVSFNEEDKCYDISIPEGGDPFITMAFGSYISMEEMDEVELDTYKIMQLKMKIDPKIGLQGNIYYSTDEAPGAYAEAQNVSYRYANTEDWQVVNVDFTRQRNWTSILDACRLDAFPSTSADTVVKVAYITFFKTLAEAQAFADMGSQFPATPEPTATPTPTPTPDVTATPEATDVPTEKPTEAPTPEPKKTGCGNVIGGTFAVIALAACALVIRKKH
ncbi:MAG: hypothetical protein II739_01445 [Clostridia bacterium]|nr:hypothetical protein [Clostridia bacterium]